MGRNRNILQIQLPAQKPDCCQECPLCGLVPDGQRPKGSKETHVCLGTMEALGGRLTKVRASNRDSHHPLHRPCDLKWEAWQTLQDRKIGISYKAYLLCRIPFEQNQQLTIKFHK